MLKRIHATFYLGTHLMIRFMKRLAGRPGKGAFLRAYATERLVPLTHEEKGLLEKISRCIACGLCDLACPATVNPDGTFPFFGPSALPFLSRSVPDFTAAPFSPKTCGECRECEKACPEEVPLTKIIEFIKRKFEEVRR